MKINILHEFQKFKSSKTAGRINRFVNNISRIIYKEQSWIEDKSNIKKKEYKTYEKYLKHQKSKLKKVQYELRSTYDNKYRYELEKRLKEQNIVQPGMNVLCLAARIGTEVKSFLDLGCFAVGLDLNPGIGNKYVVYGDFHYIQFPDHSVDVIFSNSLDHAFDFNKLIKEIKRVLKPNGYLILEITRGTEEGYSPGYWEASIWKKIDDVLDIFLKFGFKIVRKADFEYPWKGQHISLMLER
ncbi:MAG: class I SAM-dependent methyltransferase [bacterium]|nr:class I SAM-dependent methyltransferase [bacterium]